MATLSTKLKQLVEQTSENNQWRQQQCINLIPSENTPSVLVRLLEICDPAGRYAEHITVNGQEVCYYQGTDFIVHQVEESVRRELGQFLGCEGSQVEVRVVSGQMANEALFKGMVRYINRDDTGRPKPPRKRIGTFVSNRLTNGGHLSSQPFGAVFNYVEVDSTTGEERVFDFPVNANDPYKIDADAACALIEDKKPDVVVFGKSMVICAEPVHEIANFIATAGLDTIIEYDMAHTLGLYGTFQAPLQEGAHFLTGSTHKTFFGPQRGIIATSITKDHPHAQLWTDLRNRVFPGSVSNHHLGTLLGLLGASMEMNEYKDEYQAKVISNARAFARGLASLGLSVEGDCDSGYTETHQVLLRVRSFGTGEEIARRLEQNNIIVNYQALPDDPRFTNVSGLRLGVSEMTRFGMNEDDFTALARLMAEVLLNGADVRSKVAEFRSGFLSMRYCLDSSEAGEMAADLLNSLLPDQVLLDALRAGLK